MIVLHRALHESIGQDVVGPRFYYWFFEKALLDFVSPE